MTGRRWLWIGAVTTTLLAVGALVGLLMPGRPTPVEIRFAGPERIRSAPIYVAIDKGFLAEEGVALVVTPFYTGKEAYAEAMAGRQDIAAVAGMPVVGAWAAGIRPAVLATLSQANAQAAIVGRGRTVDDIRGLRGKRIGMLKATTSELFLLTMLHAAGMTGQDVEMIDVPEKGIIEALIRGEVDAVSLWEPVLGQALARLRPDVWVIDNDGSFVDFWLLATSEAWLSRNSGSAERLLRALVKAEDFIRTHSDEARDIVMRHVPRDSMAWDARIFRVRLDAALLESLKGNARIALGVADPSGLAETIHPEALRAAAPAMVGTGR